MALMRTALLCGMALGIFCSVANAAEVDIKIDGGVTQGERSMSPHTEHKPATPGHGERKQIRFEVRNKALGRIDHRLFGQFMERPSWGEIGPEAALVPGTSDLQPGVIKLLAEMKIPIVRFPGGTDVDYMDWRDMVDHVPGRQGGRPISKGHKGHEVTNRFGYDEFLRLGERLQWETIIVVNLRDGLLELRPLKEAARHAAGLVAYCNAAVGATLPEGMPDWPAVRAKNGHEKPYAVKYVQLGNETWAFADKAKAKHPGRYEEAYVDCVVAYEQAIRAVDPSVKLIIDFDPAITPKIRERLGDKVNYVCGHYYVPWMLRNVARNGVELAAESLSAEEIWYAWVSTPKIDGHGLAMVESKVLLAAPTLGYKVAATEWNWNGGWPHDVGKVALNSSLARGLGAAGFLHAFMRKAGVVEIATQSMLVGKGWGITAIRVDEKAEKPPYMRPSGMVTMLYSKHHGDRLLEMKASGVPMYNQPLRLGGIRPSPKVAMIDAVATADDKAVYWHAINRSFHHALEVTVDLSHVGPLVGKARTYVLEGRLDDERDEGPRPVAQVKEQAVMAEGAVAKLQLPARSVVVLQAERK